MQLLGRLIYVTFCFSELWKELMQNEILWAGFYLQTLIIKLKHKNGHQWDPELHFENVMFSMPAKHIGRSGSKHTVWSLFWVCIQVVSHLEEGVYTEETWPFIILFTQRGPGFWLSVYSFVFISQNLSLVVLSPGSWVCSKPWTSVYMPQDSGFWDKGFVKHVHHTTTALKKTNNVLQPYLADIISWCVPVFNVIRKHWLGLSPGSAAQTQLNTISSAAPPLCSPDSHQAPSARSALHWK